MPQAASDEAAFRQWYAQQAKKYDLNPDPDDPRQFYDYRAAFRAGAQPDSSKHWPSEFKRPGHENEIVGGFNTRTGERVVGTPRANERDLVRMGWDAASAKRLAAMPEPQQLGIASSEPLQIASSEPIPSHESATIASSETTKPQGVIPFVTQTIEKVNPFPIIGALMDASPATPEERMLLQATPFPGLGHVIRGIVQTQKGEWQKAKESYDKGNYGDAAMYAVSTYAPVAGPMVTGFGEKVKEGDYTGAASDAASFAIAAKAPKIAGVAGRTAERVAATVLPESVATKAAEVFPGIDAARKVRASRQPVPGTGRLIPDFMRSLPPSKSVPYKDADIIRAAPHLSAQVAKSPITTVESFINAADNSISEIEQHIGTAIKSFPDEVIQTNPYEAAKAILSKGVRGTDLEKGLKELDDLGLDKPLTLERADAIRKRLNAENKAARTLNKYDRATALESDPAYAARDAALDSLRDGIYDRLEARGVPDVAEWRKDEGSIIKLRTVAEHYKYSAERPVSGTGKNSFPARMARRSLPLIGGTIGASMPGPAVVTVPAGVLTGEALARRLASPNLTRDALIARAFEKFNVPAKTFPTIAPVAAHGAK